MPNPRPDLTGLIPVSEVARMIEKTRQRVEQLARTEGFPAPAYVWGKRIRLWWRDEIQAWIDRTTPPS